jgi:hypothetical protein
MTLMTHSHTNTHTHTHTHTHSHTNTHMHNNTGKAADSIRVYESLQTMEGGAGLSGSDPSVLLAHAHALNTVSQGGLIRAWLFT